MVIPSAFSEHLSPKPPSNLSMSKSITIFLTVYSCDVVPFLLPADLSVR